MEKPLATAHQLAGYKLSEAVLDQHNGYYVNYYTTYATLITKR